MLAAVRHVIQKGIEIVEQELREANYPIARLLKVDCSSEKGGGR